MSTVPKPFPKEFRDDVVRVARSSDASVAQVAKDFGISESCLHRWLAQDDVEQGNRPGVTASESAELRELRRRNRLLEQENEVLRRAAAYLSQANLPAAWGNDVPARPRAGRRRDPRHGDVSGSQHRQAAVLPLARAAGDRRRVDRGAPG